MIKEKILSCGVIPVRRIGGDWKILVLRAYKNWDFPKGVAEQDEDPLDAAKRETLEETGISDLEFNFGEDYKETVPYADNKVARYYIAETTVDDITLPVSPELGRPEHHEWRWVSPNEAEDLLPPRLALVLDWVRELLDNDAGATEYTEPDPQQE